MTCGAGRSRNRNLVATPKLPPPPPRQAQNRSGSVRASAVTIAAVGGHQVDVDEAVAGQAPGAGQHTLTAAEGETGDADGRARPGGQRLPARGHPGVHVDQLGTGTHLGGGAGHPDGGDPAHVEHDPGAGRPAGVGVAARAQGERQAGVAGERDGRGDVARGRAVDDGLGADVVEPRVEQLPGAVVARVARSDQVAVELVGKLCPVGSRGRGGTGRCRGGRRGLLGRGGVVGPPVPPELPVHAATAVVAAAAAPSRSTSRRRGPGMVTSAPAVVAAQARPRRCRTWTGRAPRPRAGCRPPGRRSPGPAAPSWAGAHRPRRRPRARASSGRRGGSPGC